MMIIPGRRPWIKATRLIRPGGIGIPISRWMGGLLVVVLLGGLNVALSAQQPVPVASSSIAGQERENAPSDGFSQSLSAPVPCLNPEGWDEWFDAEHVAGWAVALSAILLLVTANAMQRKQIERHLILQRDLGLSLSSTSSLKEGLDRVLTAALKLSTVDSGGIYFVSEDLSQFRLMAHQGLSQEFADAVRLYPNNTPQTRHLISGKSLFGLLSEIAPDLKSAQESEGLKAVAIIPILHDRKVMATLHASSHTRRRHSHNTLRALETIATRLGAVIARITAEKALRDSNVKFREFVEGTHDLVCQINSRGRLVYINHTGERLFGMVASRLQGRFLWYFIHPEDRIRTRKALRRWVRQRRSHISFENRIVDQAGATHNMLWMIHLHYDKTGEVTSINAIGNDITEHKLLDKKILAVTTRQQQRIGQDIHDTIGQSLTGIACLGKVLEKSLAGKGLPEAEAAANISKVAQDAASQSRLLAKGLCPVGLKVNGLTASLCEYASQAEGLFGISCKVNYQSEVHVPDDTVATQLYHIVQEAVNNAVKHGQAANVDIELSQREDAIILMISDDGKGLSPDFSVSKGMGLHIMGHRAGALGGSLEVTGNRKGGTSVVCELPCGQVASRT